MTEIRRHLIASVLIIIGLELFFLKTGDTGVPDRSAFVLKAVSFFFFYCLLDHLFEFLVGGKVSSVLSILPAAVIFLLLRNNEALHYLETAAIAAAVIRAAFVLFPQIDDLIQYGVFVLDAAAIYLRFGRSVFIGTFPTDKILFIVLTILTLSSLQIILCEKNRGAFPFWYFILIGAVSLTAPMKKDPIDWTPVIRAGQAVSQRVSDIADHASYIFSSVFLRESYTAGYSSLLVNGEQISRSNRIQLNLDIDEKPYHTYIDEETSESMMVRKTVYLAGGEAVDRQQIINYLMFMHEHGVSREYASLFSHVSGMTIEYAYLETSDEIAPVNSILLESEYGKIESGQSGKRHKKGYKIKTAYIDMDYGSPYLTSLLSEIGAVKKTAPDSNEKAAGEDDSVYGRTASGVGGNQFTYEDACQSMTELYGVDFKTVMSRDEFEEASDAFYDASLTAYTSTDGTSTRMKELSDDITKNAGTDYEKCRLIEAYLRKYKYDTNAVGGHDPASDMSTARGMADIAERFLFETQKGYCVHYTSAMVMLLRSAGIPARAQTGFRYVFPFKEEKEYSVSSNCAHVWPEAYIEGFGWVPFEPTSGFRPAADFTWHMKAKNEPESTDNYDEADLPELPETSESADAEQGFSKEADDRAGHSFLKFAWPIIISIAATLVILIAGATVIGKLRYVRGTPEKRLIMDVEMIKKRIHRQSEEKFDDRGLLSDYIERAPLELQSDLKRVFGAYYRIIYGNDAENSVSAEENELAKRLREQLNHRAKPSGEESSARSMK